MNQHQRKFLLEAVEKQYRSEKDELKKREPEAPSLNNYLIAAILDGSFVLKSHDSIREAITNRVRDLGKRDSLVSTDRWGNEMRGDNITLPVSVLFEMPVGYARELAKYEAAFEVWNTEVDALESSIQAMRLKVQIGSDKSLMALVDQADKLCSMSLTQSNKLLLGPASDNPV